MAYSGSTALATAVNVPILLARGMGNQQQNMINTPTSTNLGIQGGNGLWYYCSSDPTTTIVGTVTYFTDGAQLGMRNGDIIICAQATSVASTSVLLGMGILGTTNSTNGFSVMTGSLMLSTQ